MHVNLLDCPKWKEITNIETTKMIHSKRRFRSAVLRVMSPARFRCAILL
jgi:hypothetical protein